jgi:hypothetical protein
MEPEGSLHYYSPPSVSILSQLNSSCIPNQIFKTMELKSPLLMCGLLNDAVSSLGCIASDVELIAKVTEGDARELI